MRVSVNVEQWNETAIENRAKMLLEKALKIWSDHGVDRKGQQDRSKVRLKDFLHAFK